MENKDSIEGAIQEIKENIIEAKEYGLKLLLVEANPEKGYSYPYLLCYPNEGMKNTLVVNCLNDYEEKMSKNETENLEAVEQIYSLFGENRLPSATKIDTKGRVEESEEKSLARLSYRIQSATNSFSRLVTNFQNAPIMRPLIPGFKSGETHEYCKSELGSGIARELAPQIAAMVEDAQNLISERTGQKLDDKVISFGHSKESTFADHFSALNPEKVKAIVLGGTEYAMLPIEEIRLIVDENRSENGKFEIRDGIPYKSITQAEFDEIVQEYDRNKKENQRSISANDDGSYSLPMNYPVGIADIGKYLGKFSDEQAREEYLRKFSEIPRVIFDGEDEEKVDGHYAYFPGNILDSGEQVAAGEDLIPFENKRAAFEIEHASMHNRVLDYISAQRILFGRSANERLESYMELSSKLGINIQSKIYKNVGHSDIYKNETLCQDLNTIYSSISEKDTIPMLDDNERAATMSPVHQLIRRYKVSSSQEEFGTKCKKFDEFMERNKAQDMVTERKKTIGTLEQAVHSYILQNYGIEGEKTNLNHLYGNLTTAEVEDIFDRVFSIDKEQNQDNEKIPMRSVVSNAITQGTTTEQVASSDEIEHRAMTKKKQEEKGEENGPNIC